MSMLLNINARLSATENKVDNLSSQRDVPGEVEEPQPSSSWEITAKGCPAIATQDDQDDVLGIEEQVHARITEHLRRALATYLPTTNDESGADNEALALPSKKPKGTSGKLRRADTKVVNQITWTHEMIYTPSGQPAICEKLSSMAFVNGYFSVMAMEMERVKVRMLNHLHSHFLRPLVPCEPHPCINQNMK